MAVEISLDNKRFLSTEAIWVDESNIWFSSMYFNGLYRYDRETEQTSFIGSFPEEKNDEWRLHGRALKVGYEIFFLPNRSKYIHVYDVRTQEISAYDMEIDGRINCKNAVLSNGVIYFISENSGITVCQICVETKRIRKQKIEIEDYYGGICADKVIVDGKLYLACINKNRIIEYDLDSERYLLHRVSQCEDGFGTVSYDGEFFWLSSSRNVVKWQKHTGTVQIFDRFPLGYGMTIKEGEEILQYTGFTNQYNRNEKPFWCSVVMGGYLWLFPFRTNMVIKVDLRNGAMFEEPLSGEKEDQDSLFRKTRITHCHYIGGIQEDKFVFFSTKTKRTYILRDDGKIDEKFYTFFAREPENLELYFWGAMPVIENSDDALEKFISIITAQDMIN